MKGSIIKREGRKGISWLLKYDAGTDPKTGKRKVCYATVKGTRKEAEKELRNRLKAIDDNAHVDPTKLTTGQWLAKWLSDHAQPAVSAKTYQRYAELVAHATAHSDVASTPIQKLAAHQVQSLYTHLRTEGGRHGQGLAERTIHHVHQRLRQALAMAAKQSLVARNPMDGVDPPKPADSPVRALDDAQVAKLIAGLADCHLRPLVILGLGTGMRLGEMLALRWSDVELTGEACLRVERTVEETTKPKHVLAIKPPKTKKGRRVIPLPDNVAAVIRAHWKAQAETGLKVGFRIPTDGLVFPAYSLALYTKGREFDSSALASPRLISKQFKKAAARGGVDLPPRNSVHVLRHTHATQLLNAGVNPKIVSERLGHAKVAITLDIYAHAMPHAQREAAAVAGRLLDAALADR